MSEPRPDDQSGPHAGFALLLSLSMAQFMVVLDFTIVNVALPSIQRELHVAATTLQWLVSAYAVAFGGFLLLGGRLADVHGRARMYRIGLVIFVAASISGGLAVDPNPGANTSDCYRSQERADPARAAHPPRPDLPHPPTPGPRCQARSKPAGAGNEGPGVRPLSTRFFPMARHSAQLAVRDRRDRGAAARE